MFEKISVKQLLQVSNVHNIFYFFSIFNFLSIFSYLIFSPFPSSLSPTYLLPSRTGSIPASYLLAPASRFPQLVASGPTSPPSNTAPPRGQRWQAIGGAAGSQFFSSRCAKQLLSAGFAELLYRSSFVLRCLVELLQKGLGSVRSLEHVWTGRNCLERTGKCCLF
jgi:hypothetical protein